MVMGWMDGCQRELAAKKAAHVGGESRISIEKIIGPSEKVLLSLPHPFPCWLAGGVYPFTFLHVFRLLKKRGIVVRSASELDEFNRILANRKLVELARKMDQVNPKQKEASTATASNVFEI
jgi:hypothetical protein